MPEKQIKLHLGCGHIIIPGYINIDILQAPGVDLICDISKLPYEKNSIDLIYSCANIEHFGRHEWKKILHHWCEILKPGGKLYISTADFEAVIARYAEKHNLEELHGLLIGGQKDEYDWHGMIFDFNLLKKGLEEAGFQNVQKYDWRKFDVGLMNIDDYSQSYLPHMDKENGRLMMINLVAEK